MLYLRAKSSKIAYFEKLIQEKLCQHSEKGAFLIQSDAQNGNMTKMTKIYTVLDEYDEKVRNTLTGIKGFKGVANATP